MSTLDAVVLGAGIGSRFQTTSGSPALPKQFQMLGNAPVFIHAVRSLLAMGCFRQIVLAMPAAHIPQTEEIVDSYLPLQSRTLIRIIPGGERRQDSSRLALEAMADLSPLPDRVLIHDACRPFLSTEFLEHVKECLDDRAYKAWTPVLAASDAAPGSDFHQRVQTPQIFEYSIIRGLADRAKDEPLQNFADDASLCEYYGVPVGVFEGDARNVALTFDFELENLRASLPKAAETAQEAACAPESDTTFTA